MAQQKVNPPNLGVQLLTAGVSACFADFITFPFDTAKVRLQIQGEGTVLSSLKTAVPTTTILPSPQYRGIVGTILTISRQEGVRSLYNGLSAGLQRQMCFASVRLGMYEPVKKFYGPIYNESASGLQLLTRISSALTTGGMAVMVAQPTDIVKIRFQAQKFHKKKENRRYASTWQAYKTIRRDEGWRGLWRGTLPNIGRNAIVNVAEIVVYDVSKDCLLKYAHMRDNILCHFSAAIVAGFAATACASPIDVVKTRYMNAPPNLYKGAIHCARQMFIAEGSSAFYKGFAPSFARIVLWNIGLWVTYEQLKLIVYKNRDNV